MMLSPKEHAHLVQQAEAGTLTLDELKYAVTTCLITAATAVRELTTMPTDTFSMLEVHDPIEQVDQLLLALGRDERARDDMEVAQERKVHAKRMTPSIETVVMRIDEHVQRLVELCGAAQEQPALLTFVLPMQVELFVSVLLRFFALLPAGGFAHDRVIPGGMGHHTDPRVGQVVDLLRVIVDHTEAR